MSAEKGFYIKVFRNNQANESPDAVFIERFDFEFVDTKEGDIKNFPKYHFNSCHSLDGDYYNSGINFGSARTALFFEKDKIGELFLAILELSLELKNLQSEFVTPAAFSSGKF